MFTLETGAPLPSYLLDMCSHLFRILLCLEIGDMHIQQLFPAVTGKPDIGIVDLK